MTLKNYYPVSQESGLVDGSAVVHWDCYCFTIQKSSVQVYYSVFMTQSSKYCERNLTRLKLFLFNCNREFSAKLFQFVFCIPAFCIHQIFAFNFLFTNSKTEGSQFLFFMNVTLSLVNRFQCFLVAKVVYKRSILQRLFLQKAE